MPSRADGAPTSLCRGRRPASRVTALVGLSLALGCTGRPAPVTSAAPAQAPWEIPAAALGTQRLYRLSYSGPEGDGTLRVTLRFARPERYQLQAVDPLGRALFTLDVSSGAGLLLNHRSRAYCRFQGSFETRDLPLGPFPLVALPVLLLDRVPAVPPSPPPLGKTIEFRDAAGRSWSVGVDPSGAPTSWSLRTAGAPTAWWMRRDGWSILSDRERGVQIKWREVVAEPLGGEIPVLPVPDAYAERPCGAPDLPEQEPG